MNVLSCYNGRIHYAFYCKAITLKKKKIRNESWAFVIYQPLQKGKLLRLNSAVLVLECWNVVMPLSWDETRWDETRRVFPVPHAVHYGILDLFLSSDCSLERLFPSFQIEWVVLPVGQSFNQLFYQYPTAFHSDVNLICDFTQPLRGFNFLICLRSCWCRIIVEGGKKTLLSEHIQSPSWSVFGLLLKLYLTYIF